jgi:hypothetical protein
MHAHTCDYAVVRVVPRVEREEFINVGVILFCRTRRFLQAKIHLDRTRLTVLASWLDLDLLQAQLDYIPLVCQGGRQAGPIGELTQTERFHWLVSPRSTVIQISPVHCLLTTDPAATLDHLLQVMVLPGEARTVTNQ